MSKLTRLSPEQLDEVCALYLDNYSYRDIEKHVKGKFGISYSHGSFGVFFRSQEGKDRVEQIASDLREKWVNEPLAEKSSRIHALREQATQIQRMLRKLSLEAIAREKDKVFRKALTEQYYKLSAEFRAYVAQLRQETEPLRVADNEKIVSPFEWLMEDDEFVKQAEEIRPRNTSGEEEDSFSKVTVHPSSQTEGNSLL